MNKKQLIEEMMKRNEMTRKENEKVLKSFTDVVESMEEVGEKIQLVGFGSFQVKERKERTIKSPINSDETIKVPAKKIISFKSGSRLKRDLK